MGTSEFNAVGVALGCTSIPSSGEWNTPTCFTGISSGLKSHLESMQAAESELDPVFLFKVNSWGSWGVCNEKCAVGSKKRTRTIKISKRCQGKDCPALQVSINY